MNAKALIATFVMAALVAATALAADDAAPGAKLKTLIVGGGSSHDFNKWFNIADVKTLTESGKFAATYTDKPGTILAGLNDLDVLYLSNNQPMADADLRKGIFSFLDSGKGLVLVHAATWYNWKDWPEYNHDLVSGGTRGHNKYAEFEVEVNEPDHPIMAGVPKTFKISDELYHFERDEKGPEIKVLATGKSLTGDGKKYPVVWVVSNPKARIVCITLGHDGKAHDLPAYQSILINSLQWAAKK